jgi:glycosyltransferase 2 family protein
MKSNALKIGAGVVLSLVLLYFFGRSVNWRDVPAQIVDVNIPLFLLAVLLSAFHYLTRSLRWQVLIAREKLNVRFRNLVAAHILGFTTSAVFPGRLGELVKPLYLARKESIRAGFAVGTVVVERIFDAIVLTVMVGLFLVARPLFAASWPVGAEAGQRLTLLGISGLVLAAALVAVIVALFLFRDKALRIVRFLLRPLPKAREAAARLLGEFLDGLRCFRTVRQVVTYTVLSFVVWLGVVFFYWIFFLAYRVHVPYFLVIPYVFLTAIGASIPTPGMVGGFHYFSQLGLVLLLRVDPVRAAGLTVVVHALQIAVTCVLGYAILAREGVTLLQLKRMGETEQP